MTHMSEPDLPPHLKNTIDKVFDFLENNYYVIQRKLVKWRLLAPAKFQPGDIIESTVETFGGNPTRMMILDFEARDTYESEDPYGRKQKEMTELYVVWILHHNSDPTRTNKKMRFVFTTHQSPIWKHSPEEIGNWKVIARA